MNLSKSPENISDKELTVASFQALTFLHAKIEVQDSTISSLVSTIDKLSETVKYQAEMIAVLTDSVKQVLAKPELKPDVNKGKKFKYGQCRAIVKTKAGLDKSMVVYAILPDGRMTCWDVSYSTDPPVDYMLTTYTSGTIIE